MKKILFLIVLCFEWIFVFSQSSDTLSLGDAIRLGLQNNYGIAVQRKNVEISEMRNTWGNAGALPFLSFSSNAAESVMHIESDSYDAFSSNSSVRLNWTVFRGFAARIEKEKLEKYQEFSENALAVTVENTILEHLLMMIIQSLL